MMEKDLEMFKKLHESPVDFSDYYVAADGDVICACIDGRHFAGHQNFGPNSAGGSLSLLIAAKLCGYNVLGLTEFFQNLTANGVKLGAHIDEKNSKDLVKTGCGANDRLDEILEKIADKNSRAEILEQMKKLLEMAPDKNVANDIGRSAAKIKLGTAQERLAAIQIAGGRVDELVGEHAEKTVIINLKSNTTLDREKSEGKTFNVDAWAFENSAEAVLSTLGEKVTDATIEKLIAALTMFNFATAMVLNPSAKIFVRK